MNQSNIFKIMGIPFLKFLKKCFLLTIIGCVPLIAKAQTVADINTAWTRIVPMRSSLTNIIKLSNGNYLAYGHNGYTSDPAVSITSYGNTTRSNKNEVYLVEFTEAGSIVRQKTIAYTMANSDNRRYITHSRVIERADRGLLITSEHEHGGGFTATNQRFMRTILPSTWTETSATSSSTWGIQLAWNGYTWIIPTRLFSFIRTNDGRILAGFNGLKNNAGVLSWIKGCIFLDDDGNPIGGASAFKVIEENATPGTIVTVSLNGTGTKYTFGQDAATTYESTDLNCTAFNTFQDRSGGYRMYGATVRPLFNNAGEYYHIGTSGSMNPPYNDARFQIMAWRWDANRNIKTPNPYWTGNDMSIGGQILLNPSGANYDRILTTISTAPPSTGNFDKPKVAEFIFTSTGIALTQGNYLNSPTNTTLWFSLPSTIKDGIIGGGRTEQGEARMVLAKFSLCANFKVDQLSNQTYFSGIPTSLYKYTPTGAFAGATVTSAWKMTLISGALSSHPTAVAGTVLYSGSNPAGTQTTIPSQTFSVNGDARAVVSVEYTATQVYGSPTSQICNTSGQFNIVIQKAPDNVSDALCFIPPPASEWGIKTAFSFTGVHSMSTPLVADLDGVLVNGKRVPEIVVPRTYGIANPWSSDGFIIGNTTAKTQRTIPTAVFRTHGQSVAIADVDGDGEATIFLQGLDYKIYAYHGVTGALKAGYPSAALSNTYGCIISIADINNDGRPEILAGQHIFDARSGAYILNVPFASASTGFGNPHMGNLATDVSTPYHMPVLGDMDGDGTLEMVGGNTVYKLNITNAAGTAGNSYSIFSTAATGVPGMPVNYDGATVLVDFDGDGDLDVCVLGHSTTGRADLQFFVWDGQTSEIIAYAPRITSSQASIPYVGDLDGDGYPNFCFSSKEGMTNYSFDKTKPGNILLGPTFPVGGAASDLAETSGFTLFDFNADGKKEIIYRGTQWFHILDGATLAPLSTKTQSWSGTVAEYPIVADVDGDGSAEIILTHANVQWAGPDMDGKVTVYKSDKSGGWAPARPVWNQWAYNSVLINDNMTVPKFSMNPATIFSGDDGVLGNNDDVRPFNGFLQQQSSINKNGTLLFLAANAVIPSQPTFQYDPVLGAMTISVTVENRGNTALQAPFYITVYKDAVGNAATKYTHAHSSNINAGSSAVITFAIPTFKTAWIPFTNIVVRANDSGNGLSNQAVCSEAQRDFKAGTVIASDDRVLVFGNLGTNKIEVLKNDVYPSACTPTVAIVTGFAPKQGTITISDGIIHYTPKNGYKVLDTLKYRLTCGTSTSDATVYIQIGDKPDNIIDPDKCVVDFGQIDFKVKQQWSVQGGHQNTGPLVGDLDGDGLPEIVVFGEDMKSISILNGQNGALKASITIPQSGGSGGWFPHMTAVMVDADRNGKGELIIAKTDRSITSYEAKLAGSIFSMDHKWTSTTLFDNPTTADNVPQPIVTDFNGDGVPELLVYNKIYNAVTGAYIGETEPIATAYVGRVASRVGNKATNFISVADMDGDGLPEVVAGGKIYKIDMAQAATPAKFSKLLYSNNSIIDGFTAVADIDMDGFLDVVVVNVATGTTQTWLHVWSPLTNTIIQQFLVYDSPTSNYPAQSFPFIGDIDGVVDAVTGKKHPEICITIRKPDNDATAGVAGYVKAYKYNSTSKKMNTKWTLPTTDESGGTGITLFDFNNDGINELVYRDQTLLRILNGRADGVAPVLADAGASFACPSGTALEFPVIADTDGDGSANICVTCATGYGVAPNYVRVYESGSKPWAPTRKVWNQVNYQPLQINNDLTVPKFSLPKNTVFNGKYPYNGSLIQVPIVDANFNPVVEAADPSIATANDVTVSCVNATTTRVSIVVRNIGKLNTNASLPIAVYKASLIPTSNFLATKPVGTSISPGGQTTLSIDIPTSSLIGVTNIVVRIQDDGVKYPADGSYLDCDYANNTITKPYVEFKSGSIASAQTICHNTSPNALTSSVNPTGGTGTYAYAWESSLDNVTWTAIAGATSSTYAPGLLTATTYYRRKVTSGTCGTAIAASVKITVAPVVPGVIAAAQSICNGIVPAAFTSTTAASGGLGAITYQWQSSTNGTTWTNISGATAVTYAAPALTVTTHYRRNAKSASCTQVTSSNTVIVTVTNVIPGVIAAAQSICNGIVPAAFTSTTAASGGSGAITYQWQSSTNGTTWTNIAGATAATYVAPALTVTTHYRRNAKSANCTQITSSNAVIVTVTNVDPGVIAAPQSICNGIVPAAFTSTTAASGGSGAITYQWQSSTNGTTWTNIVGATAATYVAPALTVTTHYRRNAKSANCTQITSSNAVIVTVTNVVPGVIAAPQSICNGIAPAAFTSTTAASGGSGAITYQWQNSTNGSTWTNISGATAATYTAPALTVTTHYRRNAKSANCAKVESSNVVIVTVTNVIPGAIAAAQSICNGIVPAAFTSTTAASGGSGAITYQWQNSTNGTTWTSISGATAATYTAPALTVTTHYRRNAKSANCAKVESSNVVIVTVTNVIPGAIAAAQSICNGIVPAAFTSTTAASGGSGAITYQWQSSTNGTTWTNIVGATAATYAAPALTVTTHYRRNAKSANCAKVESSNIVIVTVTNVDPGVIAAPQSICNGIVPAAFTSTTAASGGSGAITYQWQSSTNGTTWTNISGATAATYVAPALTVTTHYRRNAKSANCAKVESSNIVIVTVTNVDPGVIAAPQSICNGIVPAAFTSTTAASGGSGAITYQWENSTNGTTWTNISGATAATYTAPALTVTTHYRRNAKSANCAKVESSNIVIVTVTNVDPGVIAAPQSICNGIVPAAFTSTTAASGGSGAITYQWQNSTNGSTWTNISGATAATYTAPALTVTTHYRRNAKSANCAQITSSNAVIVTVFPAVTSGAIAAAQSICNGLVPTAFTSTTAGSGGSGTLTYQWQSSIDNGTTWTDISGATALTYAAPALTVTTHYRRNAKSTNCAKVASTTPIIITVNPALTATAIKQDIVCNGANSGKITVTASGGNGVYQYSIDNKVTWQSSNVFSNLAPGSYTIHTKDGFPCPAPVVTATIIEQAVVLIPANVLSPLACPNKPAEVHIKNSLVSISYSVYDAPTGGTQKGVSMMGNGGILVIYVGTHSVSTTLYVETKSNGGSCTSVSRVPVSLVVRDIVSQYPDIRIQICPVPNRTINLSSYLDTAYFHSVNWTAASVGSPTLTSPTGSASFQTNQLNGTHAYYYTLSNACYTNVKAKVYVNSFANTPHKRPGDTIVVCRNTSNMNLNQTLGLDAKGKWLRSTDYNPYLGEVAPPSIFSGAFLLDVKAAYTGLQGTTHKKGYRTDPTAVHVNLKYSTMGVANSCWANKERDLVIIITSTQL